MAGSATFSRWLRVHGSRRGRGLAADWVGLSVHPSDELDFWGPLKGWQCRYCRWVIRLMGVRVPGFAWLRCVVDPGFLGGTALLRREEKANGLRVARRHLGPAYRKKDSERQSGRERLVDGPTSGKNNCSSQSEAELICAAAQAQGALGSLTIRLASDTSRCLGVGGILLAPQTELLLCEYFLVRWHSRSKFGCEV